MKQMAQVGLTGGQDSVDSSWNIRAGTIEDTKIGISAEEKPSCLHIFVVDQ
jgi:hypothetical protein